MTVFLGENGRVVIERKGSDTGLFTKVNASDVRDVANRFSIDYGHEQIITGDRIELRTIGENAGETINWIDHPGVDDSFTRYANVDEAGGIRLYETFSKAIAGAPGDAVQLRAVASAQETKITIKEDTESRCLAEVSSYQITTSRETINTSHLGAHYVKQYEAGLIQGQGSIECLWRMPGCECEQEADEQEFVSYLARLCMRLVHGAAFHGYFYVYASDLKEGRSLWYESESCIVTNVAVTVAPTQVVRTTISFITNGAIKLKEGYLPGYLELEQSSENIALEQGGGIELDDPDV